MRRLCTISRPACALAAGALGVLALFAPARAQGAEDRGKPASLARYFPRQDLVVYAEFDGLDAHAAAWKKTAAYRILNETTTGVMLRSLLTQFLDRSLAGSPQNPVTGAELLAIVEHGFKSGFAFGISGKAGAAKPACVGFVLRGAAKDAVRTPLERLLHAGSLSPNDKPARLSKPGGRRVTVIGDRRGMGMAWWTEGDDVAISLVTPRGADDMIATLDGQRPNSVDQPIRAALAGNGAGFETVGLAFFDMAALPNLPPQAVSLGLDRVRRVEARWGFQDEALMSALRVVAPTPRVGVLALFDQPTFGPDGLPPLSAGLDGFTVISLKPDKLFDQLARQQEALAPNGRAAFDAIAQAVQGVTGRKLKEDILAHLGPRMTFTVVPSKVNAPTNVLSGLALGFTHTARATLRIDVDDAAEFGKVLDDVAAGVNRAVAAPPGQASGLPAVSFRPLKAPDKGYSIVVSPAVFPLPAGTRPTILLGKTQLVIGTNLASAREALALEGRPAGLPTGDPLAQNSGRLPKRMILLTVSDERQSLLAEVIANLPILIPFFEGRARGGPFAFFRNRPFPQGPNQAIAMQIDPEQVPEPDDLRAFLFPGSYALSVDDEGIAFVSREAFPALNPTTAFPIALALLLPAQQAARSAALRSQSVNNLKQIGLAFHNFHSANNVFPAEAIKDKDGKPVLSWRVAILPFIEQQALYNEFHLDEPWDSEHNKPLAERMPAVYAVPGGAAKPGMTFYRGFSGKQAFFNDADQPGTGIADITDGTSNTVMVFEAREAVPWTKPDTELPFTGVEKPKDFVNDKPLEKLGGHFAGGFNALFADGSVRFLKDTINLQVLQALISRSGGEVISADSF